MDENIDFLLSYNVILVCNLHVNAGILHHYFSATWSHKKTGYISKLQSSYAFLLKARLLRNTLPQGTTIFS